MLKFVFGREIESGALDDALGIRRAADDDMKYVEPINFFGIYKFQNTH
jgi:hypothetical protein